MVFLPDTALLVPGAAGRADPAAGLRRVALDALAGAFAGIPADTRAGAPDGVPADGEVEGPAGSGWTGRTGAGDRLLVIAPGHRERFLPHPVLADLGGAGIDASGPDPSGPDAPGPGGPGRARRADVPASTALLLLRAAGVRAAIDVLETPRDAVLPVPPAAAVPLAGAAPSAPSAPPDPSASPAPHTPRTPDIAAPAGIVVVGSLSARHGPDAPAPDDPRAPGADAALLAALATGPDALAAALDDLGPDGARDLAVSGATPWRLALGYLGRPGVAAVRVHHGEVVAGAQHAVVAWRFPAGARPAAAPPPAAPPPASEEIR